MVSGSVVEASHSRRGRESTSRAAKRKPKSLLVDQCGSSLRGFGIQSTRFETSTTEIPGPCYYTDEAQMSFESRTPSFSKKGYCNGFVSTGSHRDDFLSPPSGPSSSCPGQYTLPRGMDYSQKTKNRRGQSLPFLPSPSERFPFQRSSSQVPEAGDYSIIDQHRSPQFMRIRPNASFSSQSDRNSFLDNSDGMRGSSPGPGHYMQNNNKNTNTSAGARNAYWSRSASDRFQYSPHSASIPNAHYCTMNVEETNEKGKRVTDSASNQQGDLMSEGLCRIIPNYGRRCISPANPSMRTSGTYTGQYKGKLFQSTPAIQLFDHEQHRFRDSIYGNLEEQANYPPGPGAYDIRAKTAPILNNTNAKNPSALSGILVVQSVSALGSSRSTPTSVKALSTASFRSTSLQRQPVVKDPAYVAPGPSYYNVKLPHWKVVNANVDSKWL